MTARTRSFLACTAVVVVTAALVVGLAHLALDAQIRNAYDTPVSTP